MAGTKKFTAAKVIEAIEGSNGIKLTICERLGCSYATFQRYLKNFPTVRDAFDKESDYAIKLAQSVLIRNIEIAAEIQDQDDEDDILEQVDSSDAKWLLRYKAGWGKEAQVNVEFSNSLTLKQWKKNAAQRRAEVEELEDED
jgi:hypothetical protein